MEYPDFKVCVRCSTFNQSKYITDTLNGFTIQQTNFPFVCCIIDDASSDGAQNIISNYVEENFDLSDNSCHFERDTNYAFITYAQHKTNKNCYFAVLYLKENHYKIKKSKLPYFTEWNNKCEYDAWCEGDDYWINSKKLQKQVDSLDSNLNCTCSFTKVLSVDINKIPKKRTFPPKETNFKYGLITDDDFFSEDFGRGKWSIQLSGFVRRSQIASFSVFLKRNILNKYPFGDIPLFISCFLKGYAYYIDEEMSCYREMSGGYNSQMIAHPEVAIRNQERIRAAMDDLDEYTKKKYHKYLKRNKLWCDLHIKNIQKNNRPKKLVNFEKFHPHFWPLLEFNDFYILTIQLAHLLLPQKIYNKIKTLFNC